MGEPTIFQMAIVAISAIVLLLLIAQGKQIRREPVPRTQKNDRVNRKIEPAYCFNDCVRIHGQSKDGFCGTACGIKDE
ncbi:MAG: hypothetical protein HY912_21895 [Desulfomonile tiedjei]|uniref:Uncharacterized protein n=1 Tax=Desulfomonile tiedjei TaxID=2358 RepID=A0A9D6VB14_9BACT|nr:hypothetical protein [Desulfomonile tiedjei]